MHIRSQVTISACGRQIAAGSRRKNINKKTSKEISR